MKKLIVVIAVLGLVSYGAWRVLTPQVKEVPAGVNESPNSATSYADPEGLFVLSYPKSFSVIGRYGANLVQIKAPREYMPQTNFSGAWFTIAATTTPAAIAACSGRNVINGAGAGNFYETTLFKKIYDGDCYTFAYTIHSTNIGSYSPEQGIKEFDKAKIVADMEGILSSFRHLVNSD